MFDLVCYVYITAKKKENVKETDDKKGMIVPCAFAFSQQESFAIFNMQYALQYIVYSLCPLAVNVNGLALISIKGLTLCIIILLQPKRRKR